MKIRSLELKDFRNHEDSTIIFGKTNIIVGKNNSGKSSIKGGLQVALTGQNEWTGTRNFKDLVSYGKPEASVVVEVDELGIVERFIRDKGSYIKLNDSRLPEKELEKEIKDNFKLTYDILEAVMSSSQFLNLKATEQKDFLFRLTNGSLDVSKITSFMKSPSEKAVSIVEGHLKGRVDIDDLDTLYKELFAERKYKKKLRDDIKTKLESIDPVPSHSGIDMKAVNSNLLEVNKKMAALVKKVAVSKERINQKDRLTGYYKDVEKKISILTEKLDKSIDVALAEESIFDYVTEINNLEKELETKKEIMSIRKNNIVTFESMLKKLSTPHCPLSDRLECKTDKTPLTSEFEDSINENKKELEAVSKVVVKISSQVKEKKEKMKHIESQVKLFNELDSLEERKKVLEKDIKEIVIDDIKDADTLRKSYEEEIEKYNQDKNTHQNWVKAKANFVKLKEDLELSEEDYLLYEYLVKEFSPKGVKSRILEKVIKPIEFHCNNTLFALTDGDYGISFNFDKGFDIIIDKKDIKTNANLLSSSEKLRIGIVIQDAINALTNARVLLIDDAEILDERNAVLLKELLLKIEGHYDSIFVLATMEEEKALDVFGGMADSKIHYVEEGAVKSYERA